MYATLDDWIREEAIPFSVDSPDSFNAAVDRLIASLGNSVDLLGLGEGLHGGEDILVLRNRIFQYLVEAHGYSAIAIESSFPRGRFVNEYVAGRGPDSYEAIRETGFSHNFGQLEANRELVEWMRHYNTDPSHPIKLTFYGFDGPMEMIGTDSPSHTLHFALDYLTSIDPTSGQRRRERIDALLGSDAEWENPAVSMDPTQGVGLSEAAAALRIETEDFITELQIRRPELIASSDADQYWEALQHAIVARQLLTYHAGLARQSDDRISELLGIRDGIMADLLAYIASRESGRGKVLVFAGNRHLQYGKIEWQLGPYLNRWWPAGAQLRAILGSRYAVIGTGVGISEENGIGQPEVGTLEALLTNHAEASVLIPTYQGQRLVPSEIASLPIRSGSARNSTYMPLDAASFTDFDGLLVLRSTTYTRGGPPLP